MLGESAAQSRFDARASVGLNPFVGREQELDTLIRRWSAVQAGSGQIAQICGEPGIGKSRLARAFIEHLRHDPTCIVRWDCAAHLANRALHPIVRDLENRAGFTRTLSPEARRPGIDALAATSPTLGTADAGFLCDLLGIEGVARAELDANTRARRTYDVLARWLEGMTRNTPVLILLEDAHWADAATLDFLAVLIDRIARLPAMLLVTHRPEFMPPWTAMQSATIISLEPLDAAAGARLLVAVLQERALPASVVHAIMKKSGGVPLFVEELAKTVIDAVLDLDRTPDSSRS